jgi:hypothetical protein
VRWNKLNKLIEFLKDRFPDGVQAFDTKSIVGDRMVTIYYDGEIVVGYCPYYEYIEILGLTKEQFEKVCKKANLH